MTVHHLVPTIYYYTFGPNPPALRVHSGDTVIAETRDAFGQDASGAPLPETMKQQAPGTELKQSNPVVGPVYVEEAEPGDMLAVHIEGLRLTRSWARSKQSTRFGSLTGEYSGHSMLYNPSIPEIWYTWQLDLERQVGLLDMPQSHRHVEAPLNPFIGSIGVAPRYGCVENTLTPGEFGGNMDCVDTAQGATLYLPVWVQGAYLAWGDVHALQGDGEVNGTAAECTAETTLRLEVVKGRHAEWPRIVNATHLMVAGSTRPLMDAVRLAQMELLGWLVDEYGYQREEAWQLMAQVGTMRIGNVVDPQYTVVAKFPRIFA